MRAWLLAFLGFWIGAAQADLYRWVDPESGSVKFSSYPPPWFGDPAQERRAPKVEVIPERRSAPTASPPDEAPPRETRPAAGPSDRTPERRVERTFERRADGPGEKVPERRADGPGERAPERRADRPPPAVDPDARGDKRADGR